MLARLAVLLWFEENPMNKTAALRKLRRKLTGECLPAVLLLCVLALR